MEEATFEVRGSNFRITYFVIKEAEREEQEVQMNQSCCDPHEQFHFTFIFKVTTNLLPLIAEPLIIVS